MDYNLNIKVGGESSAEAQIDNLVKRMNEGQKEAQKLREAQQKIASSRKELAAYARKDRQDNFERLGHEQKIEALTRRRLDLQRFIAAAEGNETRQLSLRVGLRKTEAQLAALRKDTFAGTVGDDLKQSVLSHLPGGNILARYSKYFTAGRIVGGGTALLGVSMIKQALEESKDITQMAARLDLSTMALQRFVYAAKVTGGGLEGFVGVLEDIRRAQSEAVQGNDAVIKDFKALKLELRAVKTLSPEQIFYRLADAYKSGKVDAKNFSSLISIMGRNAKEILPNLKKGTSDAAKEFDKAKLGITADTLEAVQEPGNALTRFNEKMAAGSKKAIAKSVATGVNLFDEIVGSLQTSIGTLLFSPKMVEAGRQRIQSEQERQFGLRQGEENLKEQKAAIRQFKKLILGPEADEISNAYLRQNTNAYKIAPNALAQIGGYTGVMARDEGRASMLQAQSQYLRTMAKDIGEIKSKMGNFNL